MAHSGTLIHRMGMNLAARKIRTGEKPTKQMVVKKERVGERSAYLTFMAPNTVVHDLRVKGLPRGKVISQFNPQKDSLEIWVNDQRKMPDTLQLSPSRASRPRTSSASSSP